jgi:DNA-binding response OmpR family regulator
VGLRQTIEYNILIVDERNNFRNQVGSKLSQRGYKVEQGTSGFHALHMIETDDCNLVIIAEKI